MNTVQDDPSLCNYLELSIECRDLANKDTLSKSDPMCVVRIRESPAVEYTELGRTERIENTLNPKFSRTFRVKYFFERRQELQFAVYDCDSSSGDLSDHDKLGSCSCSLAEIVQESLQKGKLLTNSGNKKAKIFVTARQTVECRELYVLNFAAKGLDNKDFFGKSDPFLVIYKQVDGNFVRVARTNTVMNNLNPVWTPLRINCATFNNKDPDLPIKIECYDYDNDGSSDFIGQVFTHGKELFGGPKALPLINDEKKAKKKKYDNSGTLILERFTIEEECDFLYYIQAGLQLSFIVAIDFTASNGDPSHPQSLHYFNPQYPVNQYTTAIQSVGCIIQEYDSDKLFPVFGFGGCFFGQSTKHHYPLNNNWSNPNVCGVQGILDAYKYAISNSRLSGPTNFEDTIRNAINTASQFQTGLHYFILLIITDGAITDMQKTINAIVEASYYPLSIIIVGVGDADFESMNNLDCDEGVLRATNGRVAQRDIVQFVAMNEVTRGKSQNAPIQQDALARKVLAEVPRQVQEYLKGKGVFPSAVHKMAQEQLARQQPPPPPPQQQQEL